MDWSGESSSVEDKQQCNQHGMKSVFGKENGHFKAL